MKKTIPIRLPEDLIKILTKEAKKRNIDRSHLIRLACEEFLKAR